MKNKYDNNPMETDSWIDLKKVIKYTSLSASTIRRAVQKGELKVSKKTGKLLFKVSWINNWLEESNEN